MMPKKEIKKNKKRVEEKKIRKSIGLYLGIIGFIIFVGSFFLPFMFRPVMELSFFLGIFIAITLSIIGLIISIKDCTNKKKLSLAGIIVNGILTIIISYLIIGFVLPWLISNGPPIDQNCFDAFDSLKVDTSSIASCYYLNAEGYAILNISVKRGQKALNIKSFYITAYGDGRSERFEIINGTAPSSRIKMFGYPESVILVPGRNNMQTYSLTTTLKEVNSAELAPILNGNHICDAADKPLIEKCS